MTDVLPSGKSATRCIIPPSRAVSTEVLRQLEPSPTMQIRIHTLLMRIIYRAWVACSYQPETEWLAVCAVIKWPAVGPGVERKRTVSRLLLSTRDWMTGRVCSDAVVVERKRTVSRLLLSTRDWIAGRVCSDQAVAPKEPWVAACSYQPETEWLAVSPVIRLLLNTK